MFLDGARRFVHSSSRKLAVVKSITVNNEGARLLMTPFPGGGGGGLAGSWDARARHALPSVPQSRRGGRQLRVRVSDGPSRGGEPCARHR